MKKRKPTCYSKDGRRKHHHFEAKIFYKDGEVFARRYINEEKAQRIAERQRKSPGVKNRPREGSEQTRLKYLQLTRRRVELSITISG